MTKNELINDVYSNLGSDLTKKDTAQAVQTIFDSLAGAIQNDGRFSYPGFGTFTVKDRASRQGRNPRTGEPITIPASKSVGFKPSSLLKNNL